MKISNKDLLKYRGVSYQSAYNKTVATLKNSLFGDDLSEINKRIILLTLFFELSVIVAVYKTIWS